MSVGRITLTEEQKKLAEKYRPTAESKSGNIGKVTLSEEQMKIAEKYRPIASVGQLKAQTEQSTNQQAAITQPAARVNMPNRDSGIRNSYAARNRLDQAIKDQYSIDDPNSTEGKLKNAEIQALKSAVDIDKKGRKLEQNTQRVQEVQQQEQRISQQLAKLETTRQGLEKLMADYQATGSDVTYQAYMIAYADYNKQLEAYEKEYDAYQKNAKAYDDYNASRLEYEKAYAGYEKNYGKFETEREKYLKEHPELHYVDSSVEEIEQRVSDLRMGNWQIGAAWKSGAVSDEDYKAYTEKSYAEIKALSDLSKEKKAIAAQTPDGVWGSSAMNFLDRIGLAWDAGITLAHAGNDQLLHKIDQTLYYTAGSFLKMLGAVTGSEKTKQKANRLLEASRKPSISVASAMESREELMAEALYGAGAVDGWIIKEMESIGSMMFDIWLTGGAQQLAGNVMTSGMPKLGMEKQLGGGYAFTTTATMAPALSTTKTMAIRAAGSAMIEAEEKGYSLSEQILYGIASGSLEYLSETMFGGNPIYDEGSGWLTNAMAKTFKNPKVMKLMYSKGFDILSEGFEEVFVSIAQPIAESVITWEKPQMPTAQELAESFAGGLFLSVIGQGASVVATEASGAGHKNRKAYRSVGDIMQSADAVELLIEEGLAADPRTDAYDLATKLQKKLADGKKLTASEVGKLVFANQDAIDRGLLVDADMEDNAAAPEGALHDAEDGFYAIQTVETENGKTGYQIVQVHEDGSVQPVGERADDLLTAKLIAEQQGLEIRDIGTEENLQQKAETMEQEAVLNELAQTERFEEETLQQEAQPVEAAQPAAEVNEPTTGLTWAGDENLEGVANNENQQQGYMGTGADQARQRGNAAQRPAGSTKQTRVGDALRIAERAGRIQRDAAARNVRKVNLRSLGLKNGSESNHLRLLPRDFSPEVSEAYELADNAGVTLYLVTGSLRVENNGEEITVDGIYENGIVYARADTPKVDFLKTVKHEIFHARKDNDPKLVQRLIQFINENYTPEQVQEKSQRYFDAYQDVYKDRGSKEEIEEAVFEELLADAYAEYDRYNNGILPGLSEEAQEQAWAGEEKTTDRMEGGWKASYAGKRATIADVGRLRQAKQMEMQGVDKETIRQQTGWFRGMDGMWRFEIDDSQMQYYPAGEAMFRKDHPEYRRYRDLFVEMLYGDISESEHQELKELEGIWGREYGRLWERVDGGNAKLENMIDHPGLFEAYPQLRNTIVTFENLNGASGAYVPSENKIKLAIDLRYDPGDTLVHEIQHAIQNIEGFASGASPEYWENRLKKNDRIYSAGANKAMNDLVAFEADADNSEAMQFHRRLQSALELDDNLETYDAIWEEAEAKGLGEKLNQYYDLMFEFETQKNRPGNQVPSDLYRNTAGEIEARDTATRRNLTAEQRHETMPDYGNYDTVFADGSYKLSKNVDPKFSTDEEYMDAVNQGDMETAKQLVDEAAKNNGYTKKRFHETKKENIIHVFDLSLNTNASGDYGTPFGIFTKNHDRTVGLGGKQMELFVKADNTFRVKDRTEIPQKLPSEYSDLIDKMKRMDEKYDPLYEEQSDAVMDLFEEWLDENDPDNEIREAWDVSKTLEEQFGDRIPEKILAMEREQERIMDEWKNAESKAILGAKTWLTKWLRDNDYDSMELEFDNGAGNRVTDALIVLDENQVKSADPVTYDDNSNVIPLSQRFDEKKTDIRFSKASSEETNRQRAERQIAKGIGDIMSVPASGVRELQNGLVRDLMEEFQQTGELNEKKLEAIAQEAFARGLVIDSEFYNTYKPIKDYLRTTKITISEQDQADIPDFSLFKKRAFGTLKIVKEGGLPVDTAYQELLKEAPGLFDRNITHPADQLMKMYEVARSIRAVEIPLERAQGAESDQFYEWAAGRIYNLAERVLTKYAESVQWKPTARQPVTAPEPGSGEVSPDYIQPEESSLEWAGQYQVGNWSPDFAPNVEPEENLSEMERARRGSIRDWVKFVASGKMTPEEFAKAMREAPSLQLGEGAQKLVDRIMENNRPAGDGVNLYRDPEMSEEEYEFLNEAWKNRNRRQQQKPLSEMTLEELVIPKNAFTSTPAMDKLGIKIDGSVTRYRETAQLKAYHEAAVKTQKALDNRMKKLKPSNEEFALAKAISEGSITTDVLNKDNVNIDVVLEVADFLSAISSFNDDRLSQRRTEINVANLRLADQLLQDSEDYNARLPGVFAAMTKVVMNERTPERVVKQIFEEVQGQKIYDMYFRPVWVNGAEMARFENRMKARVEKFVDQTGKKRKLTELEREFAQRLLEGEAVVERMKTLQDNDPDSAQRVKDAAFNINNGMDYEDAIREHNLGGEDRAELQGLVQAYSDYMATVEITEDMDKTILQNAIAEYKQIYNELYDAINDFLVSHGYEPIGFIRGYAPHFQKREVQQGLFGALKKLGVEKESVQMLPVEIAGRTADFKPNMKWNPHRLTRKGNKTDYDIQLGFERYLHYAAEMFYHTDDVMRIRQAVNWMRGKFGGEAISSAIKDAEVDKFKSAEWKLEFMLDKEIIKSQERDFYKDQPAKINERYNGYVENLYDSVKPENLQKYSEFVTWLDNYANIVAGKQSLADRGIEYGGGREALNWGSRAMRTFAAANVAGNLSSVLNQSAQLPLIQQQLGKYMEYAMLDLVRGTAQKENFSDRSDFLTDKRGIMKLTMDNGEQFLSGLFKPAELMDRLVSTLAVRGRYLQALDQGMTPEQALKEADDFGRRVMGSRMKGARPLGFESKTYNQQMLHVFQTEASNTFDYMFLSDMPQAVKMVHKTKGKKAAARYVASAVMGYLLNAFLWNMLTNELYGTTPAPYDLIGWLLNFVASGWEKDDEEYLKTVIDNGWEKVYGERPFETEKIDREEGFQLTSAVGDLGYNVLGDLPYVRNVMGIMGWGDQSMPTIGIGEAAKHIKNAGKAMVDEDGGLTWAGAPDAGMELLSAASQLIPMGRQIEKTAYGIKSMIQGGKYSGYGDNKRLQYPIERTPWNWIRAGLFGVSALDETDEFYAGGTALSAGQTQKLLELEELGIDRFTTYDLYQEFREINKDLTGVDASTAKRNAINNLELEDQQKLQLFDIFMLDQTSSNYEKTLGEYQAMLDSGLTWDDVTRAHNTHAVIDEEEMTATEKATEFAVWVDRQGWKEDQKNAVENRFRYWSMMPAEPGNYNKFEEAGLETEAAKEATDILGNLMPKNGKEIVSTNQKVLALQNSKLSPTDKTNAIIAVDPDKRNRFLEVGVPSAAANKIASEIMIAEAENGDEELGYLEKARIAVDNAGSDNAAMDAMRAILTEGSYAKLEIAVAYGLRPENWVLFKEEWQAQYGKDSVSQEKVERVLSKMNLTNRERAAIWQTANKSWKPANNPYNSDVAHAVYDAMN